MWAGSPSRQGHPGPAEKSEVPRGPTFRRLQPLPANQRTLQELCLEKPWKLPPALPSLFPSLFYSLILGCEIKQERMRHWFWRTQLNFFW